MGKRSGLPLGAFAVTLVAGLFIAPSQSKAQEGWVFGAYAAVSASTESEVQSKETSDVWQNRTVFPIFIRAQDGAPLSGHFSDAWAQAQVTDRGVHAQLVTATGVGEFGGRNGAAATGIAQIYDSLRLTGNYTVGDLIPVRIRALLNFTRGGPCNPEGGSAQGSATIGYWITGSSGWNVGINVDCSGVDTTFAEATVNMPLGMVERIQMSLVIAGGVFVQDDHKVTTSMFLNAYHTGYLVVEPLAADVRLESASGRLYSDPDTTTYIFDGFYPPVANAPTVNRVKAGAAVPVRFRLGGNHGIDIFEPHSPHSQQTVCESAAFLDDVAQTVAAGNSTLTYDLDTDTYTYVWKTEKAWAGTCRELTVALKDGSTHRASFRFR